MEPEGSLPHSQASATCFYPGPRSPQWSLSLQFPHQDPIHLPILTHMRHMGEIELYMFRTENLSETHRVLFQK